MRSGISAIAASNRGFAWQPFAAVGLALTAAAIGWLSGTTPDEQAVLIARFTARVSLGLFLVVYLAAPLARLSSRPLFVALDRDWARWLIAFVVAHLLHFATMVQLFAKLAKQPNLANLTLGGLTYLVPIGIAVTLGAGSAGWRWLRALGLQYVWLSFALIYCGRLFDHPERRDAGVFAFVLLMGALALRIVVEAKPRPGPAG